MPTDLPLPDLDKLHAETSAGEWRAGSVETDAVFAPCSDCMGPERVILRMNKSFPHEADAKWIAEIHNTWPTISARLKELEAENAVLHVTLDNLPKHLDRVHLLEETLRGILQEKRDRLSVGAVNEAQVDGLKREIAWLESVLGGGK